MAIFYLYRTDIGNTLISGSTTSFAPLPPNTGEIFSTFTPSVLDQALYYYRESGGTIVDNTEENILAGIELFRTENYNQEIDQVNRAVDQITDFFGFPSQTIPTPSATTEIYTDAILSGFTTKIDTVPTGTTGNVPIFTADGNLEDSGFSPANFTGGTGGGGFNLNSLWKFEGTSGNPSSGEFKTNSNNPSSINQIRISDENEDGADLTNFLDFVSSGDTIYLQNIENSNEFGVYDVTATANNGSFFTYTVTQTDAGSNFSTGKEFSVIFLYKTAGSVAWGDIIGTLSNQTDLQNALDVKLDQTDFDTYTGNTQGALDGKVSITGDTMTGDLIINALLQVSGSTAPIIETSETDVTLHGDNGDGDGTLTFNGDFLEIDTPNASPNIQLGWVQGDGATSEQFGLRQTGLGGFFFLYPNANSPQVIAGNDFSGGTFFFDANGNKDLRVQTLDTGADELLKRTIFGEGGIGLFDGSNEVTIRAFSGTSEYLLILPQTDGNNGEFLTTDGSGNLSWSNNDVDLAFLSGATSGNTADIQFLSGETAANTAAIAQLPTGLSAVQIRRTTAFALPATWGDITFGTKDFENNPDKISGDTTNTDNIIVGEDGDYYIYYDGVVDAGGQLRLRINDTTIVNGSTKDVFSNVTGLAATTRNLDISNSVIVTLSAGDFITLQGQQNTTVGAANLVADATLKVVKFDSARGAKGEKGEKGNDGAGSTVGVRDEGVNPSPTGGTYSILNFGDGIAAVDGGDGDTVNISAVTTSNPTGNSIQLVESTGGISTNNVTPAVITFDSTDFIDNAVFSANTGVITVLQDGFYKLSYNMRTSSTNGTRGNQGASIRLNGGAFILPTTTASYKRNASNNETSNSLSYYVVELSANDTLELVAYQLGDAANLVTVAGESFINIEYLG